MNRLGWTAGFSFTAYGVTIGVRTNDPTILPDVRALLPASTSLVSDPVVDHLYSIWVAPPSKRKGHRSYHILYRGIARISRSLDIETILQVFERNLAVTLAIWSSKAENLFILAGVVGWRGKAIIIPGRKNTGKSELVAELIKAGATYYSDEMAVLDSQGLVHPYPIPLTLHEKNGDCMYTPDDFGSPTGAKPIPVGLILVTHYEENALWRPRQISQARALMDLLENALAIRKDPVASLPILQKAVTGAVAFKSRRNEARDLVPEIFELFDRHMHERVG